MFARTHTQPRSNCALIRSTNAVLESLESRRLLAAAIEGGQLIARGTPGNDAIELKRSGTSNVIVTIWSGSGTPASIQTFATSDFNGVLLEGLAGHDKLYYSGAGIIPGLTLLGGDGNDVLYGTYQSDGSDRLEGGDGDDTLTGYGGPDTLLGGEGDDRINFTNEDIAHGEGGFDTLIGQSTSFYQIIDGQIVITGTSGNDRFELWGDMEPSSGEPMNVMVSNGSIWELRTSVTSKFKFDGLAGNDTFEFGPFYYPPTDPTITANGDGGADILLADADLDTVPLFYGGDSNDLAQTVGGIGVKAGFVDGGAGVDEVIADRGEIDLQSQLNVENATLTGGGTIYGNGLNNRLATYDGWVHAGGGNDTLIRRIDEFSDFPVFLFGEGGNDVINVGESNSNVVDGGSGTDTLQGTGGTMDVGTSTIEAYPAPQAILQNKSIRIIGTIRPDAIELKRVGTDDVQVTIKVNGSSTAALTRTFDLDDVVNGITVEGRDGNDAIFVTGGVAIPKLLIHGGVGNDSINGSASNDTIYGGGGSDSIVAIAGNDLIFDENEAGTHQFTIDTINAGSGTDTVYADLGKDMLIGVEHAFQAANLEY